MIRSPLLAMFAAAILVPGLARAAEPLAGVWGGDRSILTLRGDGGSFESGCSYGEWNGPAAPDPGGRFVVKGHFRGALAGAQQEAPSAGPSAEFAGQVRDDTLVLSIRGDGAPRQVTLKRGVRPRMVRCL